MPTGRDLLIALKASTHSSGPLLCLPVGTQPEAILRPVSTRKGDLNSSDVRLLTEWRNRFVKSFLTEFEATESQTEQWLTEKVGPDQTRILFMLDDSRGQTAGYLGLAFIDWEQGSGEADAIVRGAELGLGVMAKSLLTLLDWARGQLGLQRLSARVRSDNPALKFFQKLGSEVKRVPLRRIEESGMIRWVEDESLGAAEPALVYIVLSASRGKSQ